MESSDSQMDKPQHGRPKRAELPDVNINTGVQSINTERASLMILMRRRRIMAAAFPGCQHQGILLIFSSFKITMPIFVKLHWVSGGQLRYALPFYSALGCCKRACQFSWGGGGVSWQEPVDSATISYSKEYHVRWGVPSPPPSLVSNVQIHSGMSDHDVVDLHQC